MKIKTEPPDESITDVLFPISKDPLQSLVKLEQLVETKLSSTSTFNYDLDQVSGYVEFKLPANIGMPIKSWEDLIFLEDLLFVNQEECIKFVNVILCYLVMLIKLNSLFYKF